MAKINKKNAPTGIVTHGGAPAKLINAEQQLRRSVLACLLWEDTFYEEGESIADRIVQAAAACSAPVVAALAVEARTKFKLRHAPLMLLLDLIRRGGSDVATAIEATINRPDELAELVALYWRGGKKPLSAQMKRGLGRAFNKFNAYQLAKYNRDGQVKLRDVLFLCHAKPVNPEKEEIFKQLVEGTLPNPDTWESRLAGGEDKKTVFTDLLNRKKLGYMALIRNLRGMTEAGVDENLIRTAIVENDPSAVLPYRFIAAAKHAPKFERELDTAMMKCMGELPRLSGKTILLVDNSGSMYSPLSSKSDLERVDAACGLAILLSGVCEQVEIASFSNSVRTVPPRQGMALRDAIKATPSGGTDIARAVAWANAQEADRIICITDEQATVGYYNSVHGPKGKGYMINVASYRNGVGYGPWIHIDGFSEACVQYIVELEAEK